MPANQSIELTYEERYRLNDLLTAFASDINLRERLQFDTDDEFDAMLNEATWEAIGVFENPPEDLT